jgi:radical SAM protein with 4Fe4S-binding SPASM domain
MNMITTLQLLQVMIGNPAARAIIRGFSTYCNTCEGNRIEIALELFTENRKDACFKCTMAEKTISPILLSGAMTFGLSKNDLIQKFNNPSWRKVLANVLSGIGNFGMNIPFIPGSPFLVVWDITYACNLKCKHCYANAGKKQQNELNTDEAKKVIDTLSKALVPIISFSGGEPLVRPDIFELTQYASEKGIYVAVATNGTLITQEKAREMKEAGIDFTQISLDGATAETHDNFRGISGAYDKTIQGIQNAVKEGFFVNVAATANKYNYHEIPKIIDLCEQMYVNWFMMYNFVPTGRGQYIFDSDLSPQQREDLLQNLWQKLTDESCSVNVLSTAPQFARIALQHEERKKEKIVPTHFSNPTLSENLLNLSEFIGGCGCGRFYGAIRPNGNIEPCVFFPLTVGNILQDDFETVWKESPIFHDLRRRDHLQHACKNCDYRYYCGGCRARAYSYSNDYFAGDCGCIRNKDILKT